MVGRRISSLRERQGFPQSGVPPLFDLWLPVMATRRGGIFYANVVKSAESKTWGLLAVRFMATLVSARSIPFL